MNQNEISSWLDQNLLRVEKPGRYVGGEYNQIVKSWKDINLHIALVFPDLYDLGISNLGLTILYDEINRREDALAERAYAPWHDMEAIMRESKIPLYALESKTALADFDIIAFTLPYETLYTNALNILDLAGIPLKVSERQDHHPLVIAGGHATYNPEPMSPFIDAFAIGEGEELIHDILDVAKNWKKESLPRKKLKEMLTSIPGLYLPEFYQVAYNNNGTISNISNTHPSAQDRIKKRIVSPLPPPPTRFIVPSIDVVHNRISIEIMRGCSRGCRFCHAGMVNRPIRERKVDDILQAINQSLNSTGYEEIALLSLSSSDYTQISTLISRINKQYSGKNLRVSLPSLRIDTFSIDIMEQLKDSRPGGFTLAPEAATDRMRKIINKPISIDQLLTTAKEVYERGWPTLKLYFMIGHPNETIEDVQAIADLCKTIRDIGFKAIGRRAKLNAGVSTFVPKPHTPFQWAPCDTLVSIEQKQDLLRRELRGPGLKLNWTDPDETMLEAVLSRGDRRLSSVIYSAWKYGAKFDAWQDKTHFELWNQAFLDNDIDPAFFSHRAREINEVFPWDHIDTGVRKDFLKKEYQNSKDLQTREDCSSQCHACGILAAFSELRKSQPGKLWKCPDLVKEAH
jgi:radical SAM family uncharacterized protein